MFTTMPIGNFDKATNHDKNTKGAVQDPTLEHVESNMGVLDKQW